ncbi:hypothetical protein [Persicirhabdus sediminis]|uniref:Uncharacterized protein n=1 Tax=Persicirhabdus sediminis TaxID=454144 RepID=A0A8J7MCR2_9BACT|nr:hypothetical protein [Persicirhabdus sediminis]MBK1789859.1 hypothetical protein [Persicirhabdus sediminis]
MKQGSVSLKAHGIFDFSAYSDEQVYDEGLRIYKEDYLESGRRSGDITSHDGLSVRFFEDRYHHAFNTSKDRKRSEFSKNKVDRKRVERIDWIKIIIEGRGLKTECWEVPLRVPEEGSRPFPGKRAYVSWAQGYIIWLEPLRSGGFKFSTAYCVSRQQLSHYLKNAKKIWSNT